VLRRSEAEQEFMIVLVSSTPHTPDETAFVTWMHQELPSLISDACTIVHAVKDTTNPVARGEIASVTGNGYITEKVHDVAFRISPFSFFQTNSHQLHGFLDAIINAAHIQEYSSVWDLYCGTGSITLPAARHARTVLGIELSEESIDDAKHNAERNGIANVHFAAADLHKAQTIDFLRGQETPDVVILDPPRAGIHPMLLQHLIMLRVPRIVYVSCNPATQARDCAILHEAYDVTSMQAVDMFPHTFHVENIATLELRP
jgi:23S rRNA (uracil1939-C5)-methyltransferase